MPGPYRCADSMLSPLVEPASSVRDSHTASTTKATMRRTPSTTWSMCRSYSRRARGWTPSQAEIEPFLRASEPHWFVVPDTDGKRRGVYSHMLNADVSRRGWAVDDVQEDVASFVT